LVRTLHLGSGEVARLVALFNVGMLIGAIGCGWLAARRGVALAVALPALVAVPLLPLYLGAFPSLLPLGALGAGVFGAGFSGIVPLFLTGLFAPAIRARAVGIVYHAGACLASIAPTAVAALSERAHLSLARAIGLVAGGSLIALAAALSFRRAPVLMQTHKNDETPIAAELAIDAVAQK